MFCFLSFSSAMLPPLKCFYIVAKFIYNLTLSITLNAWGVLICQKMIVCVVMNREIMLLLRKN